MLFVILGLSYINFDNAKNYRRELNDCHNRRDSDAADHKKEISQINAEFRQQSKELVQSYRDLSKETEQLKKQTR